MEYTPLDLLFVQRVVERRNLCNFVADFKIFIVGEVEIQLDSCKSVARLIAPPAMGRMQKSGLP